MLVTFGALRVNLLLFVYSNVAELPRRRIRLDGV